MKSGLLRSWEIKKILAIFWLLNLAVSLLFVQPLENAFNAFFNHRAAAGLLVHANLYSYLSEFLFKMKPAIDVSRQMFPGGGIILFALSVFLSGGVFFYLVNDENPKLAIFWSRSGYYFGRMVRIFLYSIFLFLVSIFISGVLYLLLQLLTPDNLPENKSFFLLLGWGFFSFLLLSLVMLIIDLCRFHLTMEDSRSVTSSLTRSLRFLRAEFWRLFPGYLLLHVFGLLIFGAYWFVQAFMPDSSPFGITIGFAVLQIFILINYWMKYSRAGIFRAVLVDGKS